MIDTSLMTATPAGPVATSDCPLCHTAMPGDDAAGADWRCPRCDHRWNVKRLAVVAAYAAFCERQATL
jgi:tRNA(Ile2) C34 agmatinyltransferase TiaS